ncbi:serine/threonine-protein kinase OXI1 [Cajanus cajan]|uniref:non-specific serine/threonine protein kinase n=1 Tax=Cajanus cajan TaxID=3821 RepID=A0A151QVJ0_CAJCA|nr:serine/threonine-protein kinase OXI1 [Cajanus cajan]KYP34252.1 Serine/threonine-protein kinase OXI1 [Cajanus cajan]
MKEGAERLDLEKLRVISAVGRGAKGVVFLARTGERSRDACVALKVISKALILQKKARNEAEEYKRVSFEEQALRRFDHPLLPRLRGVFETDKVLGFAIDYCHGGTLHSLRKKQTEKMFSDDTIRFYAVELVLALEYLHNLGIVYRDLKPENVMIQENGHIMLVDFDLSKKLNPKSPESLSHNSSPSPDSVKRATKKRSSRLFSFCNSGITPCDSDSVPRIDRANSARGTEFDSVEKSNSFVGTEEYVAPEIVSGKGHGFGVDWWSLGVVLYEMLYGTTPFKGANRKETFYRILTKEPELTGEKTALRDLIRRLLEKDPERRIQVDEIKGHDFFKGVKWDTVLHIARPPYIPESEVANKVGFTKNDVEVFVDEVFFPTSDDGGEKNNTVLEKKVNGENTVWVHELRHDPTKNNDDFFIF